MIELYREDISRKGAWISEEKGCCCLVAVLRGQMEISGESSSVGQDGESCKDIPQEATWRACRGYIREGEGSKI